LNLQRNKSVLDALVLEDASLLMMGSRVLFVKEMEESGCLKQGGRVLCTEESGKVNNFGNKQQQRRNNHEIV